MTRTSIRSTGSRSAGLRRTRAIAAASTAAVLLAACGGSGGGTEGAAPTGGAASEGGDQLEVDDFSVMSRWATGTPEYTQLQSAISSFTDQTGVDVGVTDGGEDIDVTFETAVAAGQSPDVVVVNLFDKSLGWLDAGVTVPVDDYLTDWGLADKLDDEAVQQWRVDQTEDGQLQGFPYSGFAWPIWYNTALLEAAGVTEVPETTDDLIAAAQALKAAGTPPMIVGGNDWSGQKLFYQIIQTYLAPEQAQQVFSEGGYCASPETVQGIELFTELRDAGLFVDNVAGFTADDMNNTYFSQGAAMMPAGSWAFTPAVEADSETGGGVVENTELAGFPLPADGAAFDDPTIYKAFTGVGFMVTPKGAEDDRIAATKAFIETFMTPEVVGGFVDNANIVTPVAGDFTENATNPLLKKALDLQGASTAVLPDVWIGTASDPLTQVTTAAYGGDDAQAICSGLDQATS